MTNLEEMIVNRRITRCEEIITPESLIAELPLSERAAKTVIETRKAIEDILTGKDSRKIMIVGPCSIHNVKEAMNYAFRLKNLADQVKDKILIVMRSYLEKPRTTIGWKGLLYDPDLDFSYKFDKGLRMGRRLLIDINELGLGAANEFVRTDFPQYIADLVSWAAIGARSVEYQGCKETASVLSMPVGFKNGTSGDIESAVNACISAIPAQTFIGMNFAGKIAKLESQGNPYVHVVLRGGNGKPNFYPEKVAETIKLMQEAKIRPNVMIDCSHANSEKKYERQEPVAYNVLEQIKSGNEYIIGIMLESNHKGGKQPFPSNMEEIRNLKPGVSVTDSCIPWEDTERIVRRFYSEL